MGCIADKSILFMVGLHLAEIGCYTTVGETYEFFSSHEDISLKSLRLLWKYNNGYYKTWFFNHFNVFTNI